MPATPLVNTIDVIAKPLQMVCDAGVAIAFGVGLTVIANVFDAPVQVGPVIKLPRL